MADQPYMLHVQIGDGDPVPAPELTEIINQIIFDGAPVDVVPNMAALGVAMSEIREKAASGSTIYEPPV